MKLEDLEAKLGIANMGEEEKLALVKDIQANIPALKAEQRVLEAKTQANLVVEAIKKIKEGLEARFDELNGIVDVKVRDITSGKDGLQGPKGDKGDRGFDGVNGKDGYNGKDGLDGVDGKDGVGVQDAYIDFDGSLVIKLTDGTEINVGEVVPMDVAEKIKIIGNGGGTSQSVLDSLESLQDQINTLTGIDGTLGTMAQQDDTSVDINGGSIDGTTVGATTPAAGTFTTLIGGGGSANYFQVQGAATTKAVEAKALGSDTNIAFVIDSKGTGAIDLAAGSSGVNISNGGTVTALTVTANGTNYTSAPSVAITAPTTAGGVQATTSVATYNNAGVSAVNFGGTGYTVGDTLSIVGGTPVGGAATLTVATVSGGVITSVTYGNFASYSALPTNPVSVTGGTGSGATFNIAWKVLSLTITNAGSGYVEQPTVTFSGGGGSGAAAYATVGSATTVKTLGSAINFATPGGGTAFKIADNSTSNDYFAVRGSTAGNPEFYAEGSSAAISVQFLTKSTSPFKFFTRGTSYLEQFRISDTASAVNYVQVTGNATTLFPNISAQGSDSNIGLTFASKGSQSLRFNTNSTDQQFRIAHTGSAVNYVQVTGNIAGSSPRVLAEGSDTNIDLTLTPKGTGNVRFGTYTADMTLVVQGYITIKDSGGTVRKLAVIA